ncbi:MAG: hypothetical protein ACFFCY_11510 [Promethearchaeota archaeon]
MYKGAYVLISLNISFWILYFPLLIIYPNNSLIINLISYIFALLLFSLIVYMFVLMLFPVFQKKRKLGNIEKNILLFYLIGISILIFTVIYFAITDWPSEFWIIFPILDIIIVVFNAISIIILTRTKQKNLKNKNSG